MKKIAIFLALLFSVTLVSPFGGNGVSAAAPKLRIGYIASTEHALYFIAQQKGLFKEAGLEAELFQFANSGEGLTAIKTGKIDVGAFGVAAFSAFVANGTDVTAFGGQGSEGAALVAKPEKAPDFKTLNSYQNKKIATVRLSTGDIVFKGYLTERGIDFKKEVDFAELDTPAAVIETVKKGTVDAGVVWSPFRTLAEKQGLVVVKQTGELYKNHVCCRQIALTSRLKQNAVLYRKFLGALIKAYHFLKTNHAESVAAIAQYVKIDPEVITAEVYGPFIGNSPDPDRTDLIRFWKLMNQTGYLDSPVKIEKQINTALYRQALNAALKKEPQNPTYQKLAANFQEK